MSRRAIFLRAVNLGGTGKLPMAQFRELLACLGGTEVQTYVASGNAVADLPGDAAEVERMIADAVEERFGFRREVFVRTAGQLSAALREHPFAVGEPGFSAVCFLTGAPTASALRAAAAVPTGEDAWAVACGELHLRFAHGQGRATLDLARLLHALGVAGTARNLTTVQRMLVLTEAEHGRPD